MNELKAIAWQMVKAADADASVLSELEHRFIEILTFSPAEDINEMLEEFILVGENWDELSLWARNLAFRLACLLQPTNAKIRFMAATDLGVNGPYWDNEVERLIEEARRIEEAED